MILTILMLSIGGALGAVARYHATQYIARRHATTHFPLPTFIVNLTGSAFLGALFGILHNAPTDPTQSPLYLLLGTGFCAAFTTFSTFALETHTLLHNSTPKEKSAAAAYVICTITGCLALFVLCYSLASLTAIT